MICDGAKSSCASKISIAIEAALLGVDIAFNNKSFTSGDGLIKDNPEDTIKVIGKVANEGMKATDLKVLEYMLDN